MKSSHHPIIPQQNLRTNPELSRATHAVSIKRVLGFSSHHAQDALAVEEPLEIQLAHGAFDTRSVKSISVTMRTPGYDFDLAAGFLMTEGVVSDPNEIDQIVYLANTAELPAANLQTETALPYRPEKTSSV
ncbi:formate dehydrogenase accessory sulfurtransferase FdhD [Tunturiibacter gelidiferens]|uniref:formate dehydrogenase accessory sulfurtransferase FdhD n=1 Tax=Tunturiibacter gelidiferens TaxID=3069689 RepID=UPI003D9B3494